MGGEEGEHPGVAAAGRDPRRGDDRKYGEELMAWLVMKPGRPPLTAEAVRAFCADQLAHYEIPRYVHHVDGFPMTVTGKVRKVEIRAQAIELLGLQAAAAVETA